MANNDQNKSVDEHRMAHASKILSAPLQPDGMQICPKCGKWFAMKLVSTREDALSGRIDLYRCKKCGHEAEYAERHPPWAV